MRKFLYFGFAAVLLFVLAGCGGGDGRTTFSVDVLSSGGSRDGDIAFDSVLGTYSAFFSSSLPNTILVGEDPSVAGVYRRGFVSFPIHSIPAGAVIQRALVFLPILRVDLNSPPSVVVLVDMVSYPPLDTLLTQTQLSDVYNAPVILLGPSFEVLPGDAGTDKVIDVKDALVEARALGVSYLQIRLIGSFGQITVDDLDPGGLTPLLSVDYY